MSLALMKTKANRRSQKSNVRNPREQASILRACPGSAGIPACPFGDNRDSGMQTGTPLPRLLDRRVTGNL
jgi:hypothetical protein